MKAIAYQEILKEALLITWKNKFLWVFGLFVFLGSGFSNLNLGSDYKNQSSPEAEMIINYLQNHIALVVALGIIVLVLVLFLYVFKVLSLASLIKSVNNLEVYRQSKIKNILAESKKYFWRLVLLEIVISLVIGIAFLLLATPALALFSYKAYVLGGIVSFLAVLIATPLLILAYFLGKFGAMSIVLGDSDLKISLENAYALFLKNIKESLYMGLIVLIACLVFIVSLTVVLGILAIVFGLLGLLLYWTFAKIGLALAIAIASISFFALLVSLFSAYTVFLQTVWVLFFKHVSFIKNEEEKKEVEIVPDELPVPDAV